MRRLFCAYATLFWAIIAAFRSTRVQALLLVCLLIASAQAALFARVEGWGFLDAFYFSVVSMSTVGYGDLTPQTPLGKMLAIGFLVIGIGVFVLTVSSIAQAVLREVLARDQVGTGPDQKTDRGPE